MLDGMELVRKLAGLERRIGKLTAAPQGRYIGCRLTHSAAQSLTTGTSVTLTWDTEEADDDGLHDGTNPTRITAPLDGTYRIVAQVPFDANATGWRLLSLRKNGTALREAVVQAVATAGVRTTVILAAEVGASAGDYFELVAAQASGGTLNVTPGASTGPFFAASLIS